MTKPGGPPFVPSGFFVLRTPLLPFDDHETWTAEGRAAGSECVQLVDRLRAAFDRPACREALYVASPSLHNAFCAWEGDTDNAASRRTRSALVSYFARMTSRPTPFGLFAGVSAGSIGE